MTHAIEECPHNETFQHFTSTLERLDKHTERSAIAMEEIARQGVTIFNHEVRLNKHDEDLKEAFGRFRTLEEFKALETGKETIVVEKRLFWNGVKQQMVPYVVIVCWFLFWMVDKFNVVTWFTKLFKEMRV